MAKRIFRDLIVVLPGITGSVLERDGHQVWGFSLEMGWNTLRSRGDSIRGLALDGDDPEAPDLGDGVQATRMIHRAHSLPGLHKNIGYGPLLQALRDQLGAETGFGEGSQAGNMFEFPYDWRRDNRAAAHALRRLIHDRLPAWRRGSGADDAKVVLVAHSMGGLVSRHYLECLGGWEQCRALVTFGTPYRGAPYALEYLANGYRKLFLDISDAIRSFTSIYQLLPRYPMLEVDGEDRQIADVSGVPGVDQHRARAALAFHHDIDTAVAEHSATPGYFIEPIVGMRQPTLQSARLVNGACTLSRDVPETWSDVLSDGDGTVPRVSATPVELSEAFRETFVGERHAALQVNNRIIRQVIDKLIQTQETTTLAKLRSSPPAPHLARAPVIALDLEDAYPVGEPVVIGARTVNYVEPITTITANIAPLDGLSDARSVPLAWHGDGYEAMIEDLPPGAYQITVVPGDVFPEPAPPLHDVFEIVAER